MISISWRPKSSSTTFSTGLRAATGGNVGPIQPLGNRNHPPWQIMDVWGRRDDLLLTNWPHIDMIHVFEPMGVDVFELVQRYRRGRGTLEA